MAQTPTFSFEFFPPKTEQGLSKLIACAKQLRSMSPEFFSVTFGAGGSTKTQTKETVEAVSLNTQIDTAPHISCLGTSVDDLMSLLDAYQAMGVNRLVVLRGDKPSEMKGTSFQYACDLVAFIKERFDDQFYMEVACYPEFHPEADSAQEDFEHFVQKVKAGANAAITQYFYNIDAYFYFVDRCQQAGLDIPIVPGIMPVTQLERLVRFSKACGADIPQWLRRTLEDYQDCPESLQAFGIDFVSRMCNSLQEMGVNNFHFYTLNQAETTIQICQNINHANQSLYPKPSVA